MILCRKYFVLLIFINIHVLLHNCLPTMWNQLAQKKNPTYYYYGKTITGTVSYKVHIKPKGNKKNHRTPNNLPKGMSKLKSI